MFLAIDIGNTHVTLGLMVKGAVEREWRLHTDRHRTADEWKIILRLLEGMEGHRSASWHGAAVCSVVPPLSRPLSEAAATIAGKPAVILNGRMDLGLVNEYANPDEVGMDRLVNAVAARAAYGTALAIVDFGTATTIDIVSDHGNYLGGVIMPGLEATADALHQRTSKLPQVSIERPHTAIGRTTVQSIRSGIYFGAVEGVDGLVRRIEKELGYGLRIVATGGVSRLLAKDMLRVDAVDEDLTLRGIEMVWERNAAAG